MTEKSDVTEAFGKSGCGVPDSGPILGAVTNVTAVALNVPCVFVSVSVGDNCIEAAAGFSEAEARTCRRLVLPELVRAGIVQAGDVKTAKRKGVQKIASALKSVRALLMAPVADEQGETIGVVAAFDTKPRRFTGSDRSALADSAVTVRGMAGLQRAAV
ncbi:MAG: hypothetical protein AAGA00_15710, partial [Pseudomonadota bacterium]